MRQKKKSSSSKPGNATGKPGSGKELTKENLFLRSAAGSGLFFILLLIGIFHHEPWRDELQAFQIAMSSHSVGDVFYNLRYDGHPALWHLLLYVITCFTHNYFYMQLLHILLASAASFLILRYATFPFWMRLLVISGYYTFYEFGMVSRSYVIGELTIILFCIAWIRWKKNLFSEEKINFRNYFFPALALFLLANTSSYNLVEALALSVFVFMWCMMEKKTVLPKLNYFYAGIAILIIAAGVVLCYVQIKPLPDNTFPVNYPDGFDLQRLYFAMAFMLPAYFPVRDFTRSDNWNTFYQLISPDLKFGAEAEFLLLILLLCFQNKRKVFLFFSIATVFLLGFMYYVLLLGYRYSGHLWMVFIVALWFYYDRSEEAKEKPVFSSLQKLSRSTGKIFFPLVLNVQAAMGFYFYFSDLKHPFSNLAEAGNYLQQPALRNIPVTGFPDYKITPLCYFTGQPVFEAGRRQYGSFMIYTGNWNGKGLGFKDIFDVSDSFLLHSQNDSLLISFPVELLAGDGNSAFTEADLNDHLHLKAMEKFNSPSLTGDENYYFYLATKKDKIKK